MHQLKTLAQNITERAAATFVAVFAGFYMVAGNLGKPGVATLAAVGGLAAALAVIKTGITQALGIRVSTNPAIDLGVRAVFTYLQGLVAVELVAAQTNNLTVNGLHAAALAAIPAALSVFKGLLATLAAGQTPSLVPEDPTAPPLAA